MLRRYYQTMAYLRWEQWWFRLYYALRKPALKKPVMLQQRAWLQSWDSPPCGAARLSADGTFLCLGEFGAIDDPKVWTDSAHSRLWLYHLHYFEVLNARDSTADERCLHRYMDLWLQYNPPLRGPAWEPYPISLRAVNWILWFARIEKPPKPSWLASLIMQADVLMQRIEYHILGNHLFANGKALVFLGLYFEGAKADGWLRKGLEILDREVKEQFLPDGGHFELSPMYHALLLWDLCDLVNLATRVDCLALAQRVPAWQDVIARGMIWLSHMVHPDGDIAFFSDATLNHAPTLGRLRSYTAQLGLANGDEMPGAFAMQVLADTGYVVIDLPAAGKAILDVGHIGASYQPGHAHADILSFELSLFRQRILVNSGISVYGLSDLRLAQRGTKAHNTVCINDSNSSDVWSGFRVAARACPLDLSVTSVDDAHVVRCAHNGYAPAPHRAMHQRTWSFFRDRLIMVDKVSECCDTVEARFYFHPDVSLLKKDHGCVEGMILEKKIIDIVFFGAKEVRVERTAWYPAFGTAVANVCLVVCFAGTELETTLVWG